MSRFPPRWVCCVAVLGLSAGCGGQSGEPGGSSRATVEPVEDSSFAFLQAEISDASEGLAIVRENLDALKSKPEAKEALAKAEEGLQRMAQYFVPLIEARERSLNAELLWQAGQKDRTGAEIDRVEEIVLEVNRNAGEKAESSLGQVMEAVGNAKLAVGSSQPEEVPKLLRNLTYRLGDMLFKGRLVLSGEKVSKENPRPEQQQK